MMDSVIFVTGNKNKVVSVARVLAEFGIEVVHGTADAPEIQAERVADVAAAKAQWASNAYFGERPVMVIDSGFVIHALNGFPGPNVKWATRQIGLDGYLRLMAPWQHPDERFCVFEDVIACVMHGEEPKLFTRTVHGRLALEPRGADRAEAKSPLWKLFIPEGFTKTLAEMSEAELMVHRQAPETERVYREFAEWFLAQEPLVRVDVETDRRNRE
jgi:XTP/dITP diphosphohydrolase